jgi:outer membrane assembly lipoprotein YfiO
MFKNNISSVLKFSSLLFIVFFAGCSKQRDREEKELSYSVLQEKAKNFTEAGKKGEASRILAVLVDRYPEHKDISDHRIALADLYYDRFIYDLSEEQYRKYYEANPSKGEYASYKSIRSLFNQTLTIDRDPTIINKTIIRCKDHLAQQVYISGPNAHDVRDILYTCERKLVDREIYTFNFYLQHDKVKSAERRMKDIEKKASGHKDLEPQLLFLKSKLAMKKKDKPQAEKLATTLADNFSTSEYADMTQRLVYKKELRAQNSKQERFLF